MITFHIVTLFPESIECYFNASMLKRAQEKKKIKVSFYNPRDFTKDPSTKLGASKHRRADLRPYGGGPGMVLAAEPILKAARKAIGRKKDVEVIFFSPSGKKFDQKMARTLAFGSLAPKWGRGCPASSGLRAVKHIVMIAGHYEGVDARVAKILKAKKISIGDYVLTGGELPAAVVVDAVARYVPGVLGKEESREDERVASSDVYTRPEVLTWRGKKYRVPKVLLSGDHAEIKKWKMKRVK